ncbi:unnamed protein product [Moneuplotes crassus]|uniref:Uncharacterized protein n=1 Tax=Euplotes crassus TaxID=5936 RepID=A0AAD1XRI4_EUPCR|nr:unnamed protein product [Moneuplotes crassus]
MFDMNQGGGYFGGASAMDPGMKSKPMESEKRKSRMFVPVTIRMINDSSPRPDDIFEIDGAPINEVIIVGRIIKKDEQPTRTSFEINDNTGAFTVIYYHREEGQVPTALKDFVYEQFCYVKIYGTIRSFKEQKAIVGTHIHRIVDYDELTNHLLQTFTSHCIRKKGVLSEKELQGHTGSGKKAERNLDETKKLILSTIKNLTNNGGGLVYREKVRSILSGKMDEAEFSKGIDSLVDDMLLISTDNKQTFTLVVK